MAFRINHIHLKAPDPRKTAEAFDEEGYYRIGDALRFDGKETLGLVLVLLYVKSKYHKPKPMTELGPMELDDPELAKYKAQIDREMANLD